MHNKITNPVVDRETGKVRDEVKKSKFWWKAPKKYLFKWSKESGLETIEKELERNKMELNVYTTDEFRKLEDIVLELIDVIGDGITRTESAPMMLTTPSGRQLLLKFEVRTVKWAQHDIDRMEQQLWNKKHELNEMINKSAQR